MSKQTPDNNGKTYDTTTNKVNVRATMFKRAYVDVNSPTFCNITQSALKAGYSQEYAENLSHLNPKWYQEFKEDAEVMRAEMLKKAERNLNRVLDITPEDATDKKLQQDASKFVSERIGKDAYSTRKELTDKGGRRLFNSTRDEATEDALQGLFIGVQAEPTTEED